MTETQINLWKKIENFQIDDPSVSFSFYKRLARENGWSQAYAERVIKEYHGVLIPFVPFPIELFYRK
jgi:hypothetical protein